MNEKASFFKRHSFWILLSAAVLAGLAAAILLLPGDADAPPAQAAGNAQTVTLSEGSELLQTLTYTRCDHVVTRRVTAPVELYGKTLEEVAALYPEWQISEFAANLVKMEQRPDLFCPDHMVLMPDGAGYLCVYENQYGDALKLVRELDIEVSSLPAAVQEEVLMGVGFSTAEELDMWLEGVES